MASQATFDSERLVVLKKFGTKASLDVVELEIQSILLLHSWSDDVLNVSVLLLYI